MDLRRRRGGMGEGDRTKVSSLNFILRGSDLDRSMNGWKNLDHE